VYAGVKMPTLITWQLGGLATTHLTKPFTYLVEVSLNGVDDWVPVTDSVVGDYACTDTVQRVIGKTWRPAYRVTLTDAEGSSYTSMHSRPGGGFTSREYAILRTLIGKEYRLLRSKTGECGYLLKRRQEGVACTACRGFDTDELLPGRCEVCYGTGYVGGYHTPVNYWVSWNDPGTLKHQITEPGSNANTRIATARGLVCPRLDTLDVWVSSTTDKRYIVQRRKEVLYRGYPFVYSQIELRLAPTSDLVYLVGRPDEDVL